MGMIPFIHQAFRTRADRPASKGTYTVYLHGSTTTLAPIYEDYLLLSPIANPMTLDGMGVCPKWFIQPGVFVDIYVVDFDGNLLDTAIGVSVESGTGGLGDHKVLRSGTDLIPGYLGNKVARSPSIYLSWGTDATYGEQEIFSVDETWLANWLASHGLAAATYTVQSGVSDVPGYLTQKITDSAGNVFTVNTSGQTVIPTDQYFLKIGGQISGSVDVAGNISAITGAITGNQLNGNVVNTTFANFGTTTTGTLNVTGQLSLPSTSDYVTMGDGSFVALSSLFQYPYTVAYALGDIPGFLGAKIKAGTGVTITPVVDGTGTTMWISVNSTGLTPAQPNQQVVVGTGTGIGSSAGLKSTGPDLIATTMVQGGAGQIGTAHGTTDAAWFGSPGNNNTSANLGFVAGSGGAVLVNGFFAAGSPAIVLTASDNATGINTISMSGTLTTIRWTKFTDSVQMTSLSGFGTAGHLAIDAAGNLSQDNNILAGSGSMYFRKNLYSTSAVTLSASLGYGSVSMAGTGFGGSITLGDGHTGTAGADIYVANIASSAIVVTIPSGYQLLVGGTPYNGPTTYSIPAFSGLSFVCVNTGSGLGNQWVAS